MGNCQNDCDCDHENHEDDGQKKIYLTLIDDTQLECSVLDIFKVEEEEYIAVLPKDSETVLLYRFAEGDEGPVLNNIQGDAEYERATEAFWQAAKSHSH